LVVSNMLSIVNAVSRKTIDQSRLSLKKYEVICCSKELPRTNRHTDSQELNVRYSSSNNAVSNDP